MTLAPANNHGKLEVSLPPPGHTDTKVKEGREHLLSKPYHTRFRGKKTDTMAHIQKMGGADRRMSPKRGASLRDSLETR